MNPAILAGLQAAQALTPVILGMIRAWQQSHNTTAVPTDEEMHAELEANIQQVLAEGAAWRASHPQT